MRSMQSIVDKAIAAYERYEVRQSEKNKNARIEAGVKEALAHIEKEFAQGKVNLHFDVGKGLSKDEVVAIGNLLNALDGIRAEGGGSVHNMWIHIDTPNRPFKFT